MENKIENKIENKTSKFYELEFINGIIRKLTYRGRQGAIYNFKYDNFKRVKKLIDLSSGIYFVTKDDGSMDIYIGQTSTGMSRFNSHTMKEYQDTATINFYSFEGQRPNKTLLDYIEKISIEMCEASKYTLLNKTIGNISEIREIDEQDAQENIPTMISLLKVFGIDLESDLETELESELETELESELETTQKIKNSIANKPRTYSQIRNHEDVFYDKNDDFDFKILRKDDLWILAAGSKVKAKIKYNEYNGKVPTTGYFYNKFIHLVGEDNLTTEDIIWKSISPMVAFAKGNEANPGWNSIKNKDGKTPHEVYRKEDEDEEE